ncbi:hypothetical protein CEE44_01340 [Candidatus Woesearchaeota archaeon B3_Woes]|nr:MAG: hypothetical protein CEE44_01340 [Candidatus Woesearchaeota archaeon B3_Woes]
MVINPNKLKKAVFLLSINEVIKIDLSNKTIKNLFYNQIKGLTIRSIEDSFDLQFSGTNPL